MIGADLAVVFKPLVAALLPPLGLVWLALLALLMARVASRWRRLLQRVSAAALLLMLMLCTPLAGSWLIDMLEQRAGPAIDAPQARALAAGIDAPGAIVILGAGMQTDSRGRPWRHMPKPMTLERLHAGNRIARWTGLPVLVSGGAPLNSRRSEARVMADLMHADYELKPAWIEAGSLDTEDNARLSAMVLRKQGIERILLVTHAYHMPRARQAFVRQGIRVIAAPIGFQAGEPGGLLSLVPRIEGAQRSTIAIHEAIGLLWSELRR